jgi:pyrroloquinoline quinone biosynthesis protein B
LTYLKVLGVAQDGGYPHAGCYKECCKEAWNDKNKRKLVSSLAIIDANSKQFWLLDISPDIKEQLHMLDADFQLSGIFLTHAHVGHYIGLFQLGLEVMNVSNIPVYVMPQMKSFLESNSSLSYIIKMNNIKPIQMQDNKPVQLSNNINIEPFLVQHRNELSETVGFKIVTDKKSGIYLPDIDSWDKELNIIELIRNNDILFLDGTFYDKKELQNRDISKIPHPSILESIKHFKSLEKKEKNKIFFTHLNHTNKLFKKESSEYLLITLKGYNVADDGDTITL